MEKDINELSKAWRRAIDPHVIKAATEDWTDYPLHVQTIIEAEAKSRGLWDKVLYLRGEKPQRPISPEGNLEGYICEGCKGNQLNPYTGRCAECNLPPSDFGYCIECDKFWSVLPGQLCPEHSIKLRRHKAAMALLRFHNSFFDGIILFVIFGFVRANSFNNLDPITAWLITMTLLFFYYFIFEAIWQRTPAKFITGTKVIDIDGKKPTLGMIAKRTLIRFIPFEGFSFPPGDWVYGWHDRWSRTYVIEAKRLEKKKSAQLRQVLLESPTSSLQELRSNPTDSVIPYENVEVCKNCERTIGRLEQAYVFNGHAVCKECYERLRKQV